MECTSSQDTYICRKRGNHSAVFVTSLFEAEKNHYLHQNIHPNIIQKHVITEVDYLISVQFEEGSANDASKG